MEMEADNENPSHVNRRCISFFRYHLDGVHKTNIIEWNKKRKIQTDQLDLLRPKHKCWVRSFSSEHGSMFGENPELESMHKLTVKGKTYASVLDDMSEPESAMDSNSFVEESDTAMSVNEEAKLDKDCAKTYQYERPSNSFVNWNGYNIKENHFSLDVSTVEKTISSKEDTFVEREYNPSYHDSDIQALKNLEENLLALGSSTEHVYPEYAKDSSEQSIDKEFEDTFYSNGVNPNMYVLSSGRWNTNQEAQSSTRPPTIDREFEEYFSMLML